MSKEFEHAGLTWAKYQHDSLKHHGGDRGPRKNGYWAELFEDGVIISIYVEGELKAHCGADLFVQLCRSPLAACPMCLLQGDVEWKDCTAFADILCHEHRATTSTAD